MVATNTIYLDNDHPSHIVLPVTNAVTSVSASYENKSMPRSFILEQNFPNPTFDEPQITYLMNRTALIQIKIFNALGQEIRTLVDGLVPAGTHTGKWDGRDQNGQPIAKGIYFYRLGAGDYAITRKLMVM